MKWYYSKNQEAVGPFEFQTILTLISAETLVWCDESVGHWVEAQNHPLLKELFDVNSNSVINPEESRMVQVGVPSPPPQSLAPAGEVNFEITFILKTDWKSKGFGSRGKCHLFSANRFVKTLPLDGFEIKVISKSEFVNIIFLPDIPGVIEEAELLQELTQEFLDEFEAFADSKYTALQIPKLDGRKNYKIELEYGVIKSSFLSSEYGIKANPISIENY